MNREQLQSCTTLQGVAQLIEQCKECMLCTSRNRTVPGSGSCTRKVMLIGEGPGFQEDRTGEPFVGPAGEFLDELLTSIGYTRDYIFITNMLKCRPPNNRDPLSKELQACQWYLLRQIKIINPVLIVTLGKYSTNFFLPNVQISKVRGKLFRRPDCAMYPMMHPAAGLHNPDYKPYIQRDFKRIPDILKMLNSDVNQETEPTQPSLL